MLSHWGSALHCLQAFAPNLSHAIRLASEMNSGDRCLVPSRLGDDGDVRQRQVEEPVGFVSGVRNVNLCSARQQPRAQGRRPGPARQCRTNQP